MSLSRSDVIYCLNTALDLDITSGFNLAQLAVAPEAWANLPSVVFTIQQVAKLPCKLQLRCTVNGEERFTLESTLPLANVYHHDRAVALMADAICSWWTLNVVEK